MLDFGFYNMNCMDGMREFPDKYFDLAIVDPPYGKKPFRDGGSFEVAKRNAKSKDNFWDIRPNSEYFHELFRVSKNQIIWGANHFIDLIAKLTNSIIVWDKQINTFLPYSECEIAWTSFNTAIKKFTYKWQGMIQQNMKNKERRIHPAQKPIALYRWILQNYAKPGDIILDTHVGSTSSLIACEIEGFKYVGFEINKEYYEKARQRLENHKKQLCLF